LQNKLLGEILTSLLYNILYIKSQSLMLVATREPIMKRNLHLLQIALILCVMFSLVSVRGSSAIAPTVIDHFTDPQLINLSVPNTTVKAAPVTSVSSVLGSNILGGERDLIAAVWSDGTASGNEPYQVTASSHALTISSGTGLFFTTELQWDGSSDASKGLINPVGLGGVDLTVGGTKDQFIFDLPSSDVGGTFTMQIYSGPISCSQSVWNFPDGVNSFNMAVVERAYSFFTTICPGAYTSQADFTNVGAISLTIATLNTSPGLDMSVDMVGEDVLPYQDFGDLPEGYDSGSGITFLYENYKNVPLAQAYHVDTGLTLGPTSSLEDFKRTNGLFNATADTLDNGITPITPWKAGTTNGGQVTVVVNGCAVDPCYLTAFVDWNQDGSFWDVDLDTWQAGERILSNYPVSNGTHNVSFNIPSITGITDGDNVASVVLYARFRLVEAPLSQGTAYGAAFSGEVEDYMWTFGTTAVTIDRLTAASPAAPLQPILPFAVGIMLVAGAGLTGLMLRRK
jgi:hypothetical protein